MVRRHARSNRSFHYGPAVQVISGNYVAAKRRGVVGGVDYMHTGVVRFVQVDAIRKQLDHGNVVLLSNLGRFLFCGAARRHANTHVQRHIHNTHRLQRSRGGTQL